MQIGMLKLAGMKDQHCASKLTQVLKAVNGVNDASVSLADSKATVSYDEDLVSTQRLHVAITDAGYSVAKPAHGEDGNCCGGCGG